jgi:protein phosphatase
MTITLPELSLVLLVGPSGSGKSTFARRHFKPTETISSDYCRAIVSDDENDMSATADAFDLLGAIVAKRLRRGLLTVVDATNVQPEARRPLIEIAREYHVLPVAIVLDLPEDICQERNRGRTDRELPPHVIQNQRRQLARSIRGLEREGMRRVFKLTSVEQIDSAMIERQPLWNNRRGEHGPFDIIGDLHGCCDELEELLERLGYTATERSPTEGVIYRRVYAHPAGRRAIFLGDIVDRGPRILDSYELVRNMTEAGSALCVPGNHDIKLMRALRGRQVSVGFGLGESLAELAMLRGAFISS